MDGFKRDNLFQPGRYYSMPHEIARRRDITPASKLVWQALAGHLGPDGTEVWPSTARLADLSGISRDSAIRSVRALRIKGLLEVLKTPGKPNRYRLLQPEAGQSQNATSRKKPLVAKCNQSQKATGRKMQPHQSDFADEPVAKSDPNYCIELLNTPLPPTGGECEPVSLSGTLEENIARVEQAYREVFGAQALLPSKWRRRITRGWTRGDSGWIIQIDADAIRGGIEMTRRSPLRVFGLGWVQKYIEQSMSMRHMKHVAMAMVEKSKDFRLKEQQRLDAELAEKHRHDEQVNAWFRALPNDQQKTWIEQAARDFPRLSPSRQQGIAADLAWKAQEVTE